MPLPRRRQRVASSWLTRSALRRVDDRHAAHGGVQRAGVAWEVVDVLLKQAPAARHGARRVGAERGRTRRAGRGRGCRLVAGGLLGGLGRGGGLGFALRDIRGICLYSGALDALLERQGRYQQHQQGTAVEEPHFWC